MELCTKWKHHVEAPCEYKEWPLNYITWKADSRSKSEAKHGGTAEIEGILARHSQSRYVRGQLKFL
jgi:hypothetical protein